MVNPELSSWAVYRRLLRYSLPHWPVFVGAVIGMVIFAGVDVAFIRLIQPLTDGSFVKRDPFVMQMVPYAILGLFILRGVGYFASTYGMAWIAQKVIAQMRADIFDHVLRLPVAYFDRSRSSDLVVKLTYHATQVADAASSVLTSVIKDGLTLAGTLAIMWFNSWQLTLIALSVAPFVAFSVRYVSRRFKLVNQRLQGSMGNVSHVADEAVVGRRIVKVYGGEAHEARRFGEASEFIRRQTMKLVAASAGSTGTVQLLAAVAIALIVHLAVSGNMLRFATPGTFISFMVAMIAIRAPMNSLTGINERLSRGLTAALDLFQFLDTPAEPPGGDRALVRARGEIRFEGAEFAYSPEAQPAVAGVTLDIKPGQTVAFVGKTGSGKSTLLSLLPRFYDVTAGRVLIDGVDVREYRVADLRRQVALVDQNVVLFNASVAENIAYGLAGQVSDAQIEQAARAAHAWEFIENKPQGLATPLGQNGVQLSGGQRQRIAIARALLRNAPILILDEATSALDSESERHIQAALETLVQGRTTLVIAHRLSTVQRADLIVVLAGGRVVESGKHSELLARNGAYAALHQMQFEDA